MRKRQAQAFQKEDSQKKKGNDKWIPAPRR